MQFIYNYYIRMNPHLAESFITYQKRLLRKHFSSLSTLWISQEMGFCSVELYSRNNVVRISQTGIDDDDHVDIPSPLLELQLIIRIFDNKLAINDFSILRRRGLFPKRQDG